MNNNCILRHFDKSASLAIKALLRTYLSESFSVSFLGHISRQIVTHNITIANCGKLFWNVSTGKYQLVRLQYIGWLMSFHSTIICRLPHTWIQSS